MANEKTALEPGYSAEQDDKAHQDAINPTTASRKLPGRQQLGHSLRGQTITA
jgi:hypothetical protein